MPTVPSKVPEARPSSRPAPKRSVPPARVAVPNHHRIAVRRFAGPSSFVGEIALRVAHVTDIHVGRVTPMSVQYGAVDLVNAERPDLVVLTGDFVCHSQDYLDAVTDLVKRYEAPVLAVLGNHDHWAGADEVRHALEKGGAQVLDNVNTVLTLRRQQLQVVGLDDAYTSHASRSKALKGMRKDLPTLGLSHIAEEADGLWAAGVPLVLSGHTHGGQITFARLHELAIGKLGGHKYVHGLYGTRKSQPDVVEGSVYVGAGIGASVMPLRIGERGKREVTIFELGAAPGSIEEHHEEQPPLAGRKPSPEVVMKRHFAVHEKKAKRDKAKR
jgi:hypothetical protein